jgi:hypothetical protein
MTADQSISRVAVITGASSGIGEATARALHADGHRAALLARRGDRIHTLADELGQGAIAIEAEVTDRDSIIAAAAGVQIEPGAVATELTDHVTHALASAPHKRQPPALTSPRRTSLKSSPLPLAAPSTWRSTRYSCAPPRRCSARRILSTALRSTSGSCSGQLLSFERSANREGWERGKNGKDPRSFAFAQLFGRCIDFVQPCGLSEHKRTDANVCTESTSWGSLVRAQYRPFKNPLETAGFFMGLVGL